VCNPNGCISVESLGKALVKYRIEFQLAELQQMMALCRGDDLEEDTWTNFDNSEIHDSVRNMVIDYERFKQFY
jgi:hypothetical protein